MTDIRSGEAFKTHTNATNPPKTKIHICINEYCYLWINSKDNYPFSLPIRKSDCSVLDYDSYICCSNVLSGYDKSYKIIAKEELSDKIIKDLIDYISVIPTLTQDKINLIINSLEEVLLMRNNN